MRILHTVRKNVKVKINKSQPNSRLSSTRALNEASSISSHLCVLEPQIQKTELCRRTKLIYVLRYDNVSVAVLFSRRELWCQFKIHCTFTVHLNTLLCSFMWAHCSVCCVLSCGLTVQSTGLIIFTLFS